MCGVGREAVRVWLRELWLVQGGPVEPARVEGAPWGERRPGARGRRPGSSGPDAGD